ncbi:MAG TPA: hypothetical protein DCR21_03760 [Succinivibrionaceae bacterium]|nr:hypothetical protein [Succinivibrionaceae bacterium]
MVKKTASIFIDLRKNSPSKNIISFDQMFANFLLFICIYNYDRVIILEILSTVGTMLNLLDLTAKTAVLQNRSHQVQYCAIFLEIISEKIYSYFI